MAAMLGKSRMNRDSVRTASEYAGRSGRACPCCWSGHDHKELRRSQRRRERQEFRTRNTDND